MLRLGMAVCGFALLFGGAKNLVAVSPAYTASSIVNSASGVSAVLVPNGLATVYGTNLSSLTQAIAPNDVQDGKLPFTLNGTGVSVLVGGLRAHILYVSPSQVNFLVPSLLTPGPAMVEVVRSGASGGPVRVLLAGAMPGLFLLKPGVAVATHADGTVIADAAPASPGEIVVLYATGLGETIPKVEYGRVAPAAAWVVKRDDFHVVLDGRTVIDGIFYAGVTPGFGGLYQVNLKLPDWAGPNPEVRIYCGDASSPAGVRLPVATGPAVPASSQ
ncbi:MAG: hypothetical protein ABI972_08330 [Acidobacteriota bacterium]